MAETQALYSQVDAARYLGVSVRWFRDNVHVEPIPVGPVSADRRPLLRYRREDLDQLVAVWAARRSAS